VLIHNNISKFTNFVGCRCLQQTTKHTRKQRHETFVSMIQIVRLFFIHQFFFYKLIF